MAMELDESKRRALYDNPSVVAMKPEIPSLRDLIAMVALHGMLGTTRDGTLPKSGLSTFAIGSYLLADEMLAARARTRKE